MFFPFPLFSLLERLTFSISLLPKHLPLSPSFSLLLDRLPLAISLLLECLNLALSFSLLLDRISLAISLLLERIALSSSFSLLLERLPRYISVLLERLPFCLSISLLHDCLPFSISLLLEHLALSLLSLLNERLPRSISLLLERIPFSLLTEFLPLSLLFSMLLERLLFSLSFLLLELLSFSLLFSVCGGGEGDEESCLLLVKFFCISLGRSLSLSILGLFYMTMKKIVGDTLYTNYVNYDDNKSKSKIQKIIQLNIVYKEKIEQPVSTLPLHLPVDVGYVPHSPFSCLEISPVFLHQLFLQFGPLAVTSMELETRCKYHRKGED